MKLVVIPADLEAPIHAVDAVPGQTLGVLQDTVGGYADVVPLGSGIDLWINDEGLLMGLPVNPRAMSLLEGLGQPLVGDVVLAGSTPDGETVGLPEGLVMTLTGPLA